MIARSSFILKGIERQDLDLSSIGELCFILKGIESLVRGLPSYQGAYVGFILKGIESTYTPHHFLSIQGLRFHPQRN